MKSRWPYLLSPVLGALLVASLLGCAPSYTTDNSTQIREIAYDNGYTDGYDAGYAKGEDEGHAKGFTEGKTSALAQLNLSQEAAQAESYTQGYQIGYDEGFEAGCRKANIAKFVEAIVIRVVDGDTIEVDINGSTYKVRYIGIDTPEVGEDLYDEATDKNRELVGDKLVWLEKDISETDKYGRLLRYIHVGNIFVNAELVRLGLAEASDYPPDSKYQDYFCYLDTPPEEGTNDIPDKIPTDKYVGSINSNVYHRPSCRYVARIYERNKIWFSSPEDARAHGYRPCLVCKPP